MDIKVVFGVLSVVANFIGYIPYFKDVLGKRTKPHVFTWFTWSVLATIGFFVQVTNDAGPGSWVMGFTALATFIIFLLALKQGEKNITKADWVSMVIAAIALALWFISKNPLLSIILITFTDVIGGFLPTFRKSYLKPYEETISLYVMYAIAWILSLLALEKLDLINAFAPVVFIVVNGVLVVFLFIRRKQIHTDSQ
jgi:chromate transport protein ChrA